MDPDRHPSPLCMQCIGDPEHHKNPECQWYGGPWLPTQEELDEAPQIKYPPPNMKGISNMAPQDLRMPAPVHKQTSEEFWDRIAQIEQHDPYHKRHRRG